MTVTYISEKCTTKSIVNTNEIIRAVLNFLFFNKKISHAQKSIKSTKKAPKSTKKHQKQEMKGLYNVMYWILMSP